MCSVLPVYSILFKLNTGRLHEHPKQESGYVVSHLPWSLKTTGKNRIIIQAI